MTARPIIGIPCLAVRDQWFGITNGNYTTYLRAIEAAGGIPALIHLTDNQEVLRAHYDRCDGILFAGGDDIDPARYGEPPQPGLGTTVPMQDAVELTLAAWAREDATPVLGVCRGLQLLNVAFGGTLYQDLPSQRSDALDHRASQKQERWTLLAHPIAIATDSWLAARLDCDTIAVNTLHHQAVKELAPGLRATAQAPDGIVEAIEGETGQFVVAVQCHPETLWEDTEPRWARLFADFVEQCSLQK